MAGQVAAEGRVRQSGPANMAFGPMPGRRAPHETLPSAGTLMVRWLILYSILLSAVWAFLGSSIPD